MSHSQSNTLPLSEVLRPWTELLAARFNAEVWLVGSALQDSDSNRDVDIRILIPDEEFAARYGQAISLWRKHKGSRWIRDVAYFNREGVLRYHLNFDLQIWPTSKGEYWQVQEQGTLLAKPWGAIKHPNADLLQRRRNWRPLLLAWAERVRGLPYVWGQTDCFSLAREAIAVQFGEQEPFPDLPHWSSLREGLRVWATWGGAQGLEAFFSQLGATSIVTAGQPLRQSWPMGTILAFPSRENKRRRMRRLPALVVVVPPILVQSEPEHGVHWADPTGVGSNVVSAWLFEWVEGVPRGG